GLARAVLVDAAVAVLVEAAGAQLGGARVDGGVAVVAVVAAAGRRRVPVAVEVAGVDAGAAASAAAAAAGGAPDRGGALARFARSEGRDQRGGEQRSVPGSGGCHRPPRPHRSAAARPFLLASPRPRELHVTHDG